MEAFNNPDESTSSLLLMHYMKDLSSDNIVKPNAVQYQYEVINQLSAKLTKEFDLMHYDEMIRSLYSYSESNSIIQSSEVIAFDKSLHSVSLDISIINHDYSFNDDNFIKNITELIQATYISVSNDIIDSLLTYSKRIHSKIMQGSKKEIPSTIIKTGLYGYYLPMNANLNDAVFDIVNLNLSSEGLINSNTKEALTIHFIIKYACKLILVAVHDLVSNTKYAAKMINNISGNEEHVSKEEVDMCIQSLTVPYDQVDNKAEFDETLLIETSNKLGFRKLYSNMHKFMMLELELCLNGIKILKYNDFDKYSILVLDEWNNTKSRFIYLILDLLFRLILDTATCIAGRDELSYRSISKACEMLMLPSFTETETILVIEN